MKELLKYVDPSLHERFIEEYNSLHKNKEFLSPLELSELVIGEVCKVFDLDREKIIGNGRRPSDHVSLACMCATFYLKKLDLSNVWVSEVFKVDPSLVTYRLKSYHNNHETNKSFRVHSHQVGFNLNIMYPSISWLN